MKKIFTILCIIYCFLPNAANAQGIYQLWGSLPYAGPDNAGVIFSTKYDGTGFKVKHNFTNDNPGKAGSDAKPVLYNNKFYAMMREGGAGITAMIGEYDPATNSWVKKIDFLSFNGSSYDDNGLLVYNNKIYGISRHGGVYNGGFLFEYDLTNNTIIPLHQFSNFTGEYPNGFLTGFNNKLYGTTTSGGVVDEGVLFEFDLTTSIYQKKADFNSLTIGKYSGLDLSIYNGKIWGITTRGALNNNGAIFSFDPATNVMSKKLNLDAYNILNASGTLTLLNNKFYSSSQNGGDFNFGFIFEYDPATNLLIKKRSYLFVLAHGNTKFTTYNNKLYSSTSQGGLQNEGGIISYDPVSDIFSQGFSFTDASGIYGSGYLSVYNNKLYGFTQMEGTYGDGSLFSFDPANTQFQDLVHLGDAKFKRPEGAMYYYNHKFYGTSSSGGANRFGGIYEYDPATDVRTMLAPFTYNTTGYVAEQGGLTLLNDKFYLVTRLGGTLPGGALLEFDIASGTLIKKHDFDLSTGANPFGQLTVFNGKLYGTCSQGGTGGQGNIFEFDPATNVYSEKVVLSPTTGNYPRGRMTIFNNKLYGVTFGGGTFSKGVVFEYNPNGNIYSKKADFTAATGKSPWAGMTVFNNKLYGTTYTGGTSDSGTIFQFDPVTSAITTKVELDYTTGDRPLSRLTTLNNKLYGMFNRGGSEDNGTLISFEPGTGLFQKKMDFTIPEGSIPVSNELSAIPARTAPGQRFTCQVTNGVNINAANANEWIAFTDEEGRAVAEINANGNLLGMTSVGYYTHDGATRKTAADIYYLNRNITIQRANDPITPVSIRLYIRKDEFDKFKATPGVDVNTPADLTVFNNDDECTPTMELATVPISATQDSWNIDYVYSADVLNLTSSFYFGKAGAVVPVKLLSFTGKKETSCNKLVWQASCTEETIFSLEKSNDGINFSEVHNITTTPQNGSTPFTYSDCNISSGKTFYRLKMKENNSAGFYSNQIVIDRNERIENVLQLIPNPVTGNSAKLKITAAKNIEGIIAVVDVAGKKMLEKKVKINAGINNVEMNVSNFAAGIYFIIYKDGNKKEILKMVKQ